VQVAPTTNVLAILGIIAAVLAVAAFMTSGGYVLGVIGIILGACGITYARPHGVGMQLSRWAFGVSIAATVLTFIWDRIT
jgi:membrane-bound ClpP family serine protease